MIKTTHVLTGLVLLAIGAAAGLVLRPGSDTDEIAALRHELEEAIAEREQAARELDDARTQLRSAERDVASARRSTERVQPVEPATTADDAGHGAETGGAETTAADAAAAAEGADATAGGPDAWRERVRTYPAFAPADSDVAEAFTAIDWVGTAEHMSAMLPLLTEIVEALEVGEQPSPETSGAVQMHNGPLVMTALTLANRGVPGTGANGAFTHPSFVVNAVAANLDALAMPLDAEQRRRLATIGSDFAARDHKRLANYPDDALVLLKLIEEVELKAALYESIFEVLRPAQADALSPPAVRGRVRADLHSEGLVWAGRVQMMGYRDPPHLVELIEGTFISVVQETSRERAHDIVVRWVEDLPAALVDWKPDALDRIGMLPARHATACARQSLTRIESLLRDADMGERGNAAVRQSQGTIVPFRSGDG